MILRFFSLRNLHQWFLLIILALALHTITHATESRRCDTCRIEVQSLDQPIPLSGYWLFTREDDVKNAAPETPTEQWRTLKTPGPWNKAYPGEPPARVGWYRANFHFAPHLIGQEALFLAEAHMSKVDIYLDGKRVFSRDGQNSSQKAYSMQGIPIRFPITQQTHVIAVRVNTILPMGLYHLPLEIRRYDPKDRVVSFWQIWGGEVRLITCFTGLFFSLFFFYVARTTRSRFYFFSGLMALSISPFFASHTDLLQRYLDPDDCLMLQHSAAGFPFAVLPWFLGFMRPSLSRRIKIAYSVTFAISFLVFLVLRFHFDLALFQKLQGLLYGLVFAGSLHLAIVSYKAWRVDRSEGAQLAFLGILLFNATVVITVLTAADLFISLGTTFIGTLTLLACSIIIASRRFAKTFVQNADLLVEVKGLNEALEQKVQLRTAELRAKNQDITAMLQNLPQGILTIVNNGYVHPEYSAHLEEILETKEIPGKKAIDLLFRSSTLSPEQVSQAESGILSIIGEPSVAYDFNAHCLPPEAQIITSQGKEKTVEFTWSVILNEKDDSVEKLMVSMRDVSQLRELTRESAKQKKQLERIQQLISIEPIEFKRFMLSSRSLIKTTEELLEALENKSSPQNPIETAHSLFRALHTLKGNARTYRFTDLSAQAHAAEQASDPLRKGEPFDQHRMRLFTEFNSLIEVCDEYERIHDHVLKRGTSESDQHPSDSKISPEEVFSPLIHSCRELATSLKKFPPQITLTGDKPEFQLEQLQTLRDVFVHLLRNSIDHGIEDPETREKNGKTPEGKVQIRIRETSDHWEFELEDDGRGLDLDRILARAKQAGLLLPPENAPTHEIAEILFAPGFSTAKEVTDVSGRGVGLDAVRTRLRELGGSISIETSEPHPADRSRVAIRWRITLPRTQARRPLSDQNFAI